MAKRGAKVLLATKEMSPQQVFTRIDAVASNVSYADLKDGCLSHEEEKRFIKYIREDAPRLKDRIVVELVIGGATEVAGLVDKHNPDVCIVDSAYLFLDNDVDDDWRAITSIWRSFKQLARTKQVPFILTTQLKEEKASLQNASFARAINNESDYVLAMEQDKAMRAEREVRTVCLKIRDGAHFVPYMRHWDWSKTHYDVIYQEEDKSKPTIDVPKLEKIS